MARQPTGSILKDPEIYVRLRDEGASKEKAARIANPAAKEGRSPVGSRGGDALTSRGARPGAGGRGQAKELGLTGCSWMRTYELIERPRGHGW
jgi:hypothetical protein